MRLVLCRSCYLLNSSTGPFSRFFLNFFKNNFRMAEVLFLAKRSPGFYWVRYNDLADTVGLYAYHKPKRAYYWFFPGSGVPVDDDQYVVVIDPIAPAHYERQFQELSARTLLKLEAEYRKRSARAHRYLVTGFILITISLLAVVFDVVRAFTQH